MKQAVSPMMKQYFEIKSQYEDCILFFRLGDFYEMFYDDALTASEILDITLTGRDCGLEERAPMCGVPFHSAQNYIAKLIKNGKKVAICEQVEDPKSVKGIVKRDVIRVITPGTANLDAVLTSDENNFLACVYMKDGFYAMSICDVSTGELITTEGSNDPVENQLVNTLACFKPKEIIINDKAFNESKPIMELKNRFDFYESYVPESYFEAESAKSMVFSKFDVLKKDNILENREYCVRSLGALFEYLKETQKIDLSHIENISFYKNCDYMEIDMSSRRNLELTETMRDKTKRGSLYYILDKTKTGMGARRLKSWIDRPLINTVVIEKRLDAVSELAKKPQIREDLTDCFKKINDIERLISKIVYASCNARDFLSLKQSLEVLPEIQEIISSCESTLMKEAHLNYDPLRDLYTLLDSSIIDDPQKQPPMTIREGGIIKEGFDKELDRLRSIMNNGTGVLAELEAKEKERTGIKNLKVSYNKVYGYYIEVTKSYLELVPKDYIRKQTLTNCERFITQDLKELENTILGAKERVNDLEYEDFMYIRGELSKNIRRLKKMAELISVTDVLCSLATVAVVNGYVRPEINDGDEIKIEGGRHPIVELYATESLFVPNDTYLNTTDSRFAIITGPNMAGKSTYMRQTALITLMAQIGSFVPAKSAKIGLVDRIFTRIGASDDLASGQSTFMVEMNEVAHILKNATKKSLLVLDEIGRGTSTYDGLSIAWAVVEYICAQVGAKSLFATHYHELIELEDKIDGVKNYSVAVKRRGEDITFLRKIVRGGTDDSFGIEVARLAGVPDEVIDRARDVLSAVESGESKSDTTVDQKLNRVSSDKAKAEELYDAIMAVDITTLTPLEAMNELYNLQKKVGEISEN
ncbi:MAG: DNA mismatch repair protein MutS [Clostridia bacterium]|nr:DNA mismatch repair protein MutS [Clostridia bacterium]